MYEKNGNKNIFKFIVFGNIGCIYNKWKNVYCIFDFISNR